MINKLRYWFINVPRQRKANKILRERAQVLYIGPQEYLYMKSSGVMS